MEKVKNLPVMRFVAFALAVVIILGLSSVMLSFTASADTPNDISSATDYDKDISFGTLKNYSCIKLSYSSEIDYLRLRNLYNQVGSPYMIYSLFGVGSSGKLVCLSSNYGEVYKNNDYTGYQYASIPDIYYVGKSYKFKLGFSVSPADSSQMVFNTFRANYDSDSFNQYGTYASIDKSLYSNFYLVYTGLPDKDSATFNSFITDVSSNISSSDFSDSSDTSPKAEFVTCASYKTDDNSLPLWFKDFTSEGQQYPLFTYYIHDNGNKHSYSLKLSFSSSAKEDVKKVFNLRENTPADADSATKDLIERIIAMYAIHGVKIHDLSPYVRTSLNLKFPNNLTYNQAFVLSSPEMDFTVSGNNKVFTICLSDYSDILQCLIYKAEIIDNNTGLVLDTTYFASKQTYNKGNSGFGSKIYDYNDNYDDMIGDIKNNTPSVQPIKKDSFISDGDVIISTKYDYYSGLKIDDIFGSLQSSASSLGSFFQACMSIIPGGILAVIIGGLSIVIVLRILGR